MPGRQAAWNDAKNIRDKEFKQRDAEIKKWKDLYEQWEALLKAGDMDGARAKSTELSKQGQVVAQCMAIIDGKLEAMTALIAADTLATADKAIEKLIRDEFDMLISYLRELIPDFLEGIFKKRPGPLKKHEDAFGRAYTTFLNIKGKQEILKIVDKNK